MRATVLSCTLKPSPATSNTEALARVDMDALEERGVETELIRVADRDVRPGVSSDEDAGDEWPAIRERVLAAEILVIATPTWLGRLTQHCQSGSPRVLLLPESSSRRPQSTLRLRAMRKREEALFHDVGAPFVSRLSSDPVLLGVDARAWTRGP